MRREGLELEKLANIARAYARLAVKEVYLRRIIEYLDSEKLRMGKNGIIPYDRDNCRVLTVRALVQNANYDLEIYARDLNVLSEQDRVAFINALHDERAADIRLYIENLNYKLNMLQSKQ